MSTIKKASVAGTSTRRNVLAPLRVTEIISTKAVLPAEILATVLEWLPVPDLLRCARVSKRLQEMVYEDGRWVRRLISMGCWHEAEARRQSEDLSRRHLQTRVIGEKGDMRNDAGLKGGINGSAVARQASDIHNTTIVDAEAEKRRIQSQPRSTTDCQDAPTAGSVPTTLLANREASTSPLLAQRSSPQLEVALRILSTVRSVRSMARQEYGRVYKALAPFYYDIARSTTVTEPKVFRTYRAPEQQATMLAELNSFAKSDFAPGAQQREEKLSSMIDAFENAALREFEHGLQASEVETRMRKYAHVLYLLNGGQKAVDIFIRKHPLLKAKATLGDPMDCIINKSTGVLSLEPSYFFFERLSAALNETITVVDRVFLPSLNVLHPFLDRVEDEIVSEYVTALLDEGHKRSHESYLKAVPGVYEQMRASMQSLRLSDEEKGDALEAKSHEIVARVFEPHVELYLREELDFFKQKSSEEVDHWEQKLSEQDASTESFFMSHVNRQAAKKDFLSSFKKVVMMPVNVLPSFPMSSPFASSKPQVGGATGLTGDPPDPTLQPSSRVSTRPGKLSSSNSRAASPGVPPPSTAEAPTTELAAKAAIMNSRLEGIRSLFSIEVALNLIHAAKSSLDRAALFVELGGQIGDEAKEQCETIFILLLQVLNSRHVKPGFDQAVEHLSKYNPREVSEHNQPGVVPLVTFLELVNVGDLILQMIDVFYEQELVAKRLVDRGDFLAGTVKEKKRFEQMLDERVAAGLNKGIDVLMDEVEYLFATLQKTTDFDPPSTSRGTSTPDIDVGPTHAAERIVDVVSSHTKMLVGTTDKNMLDVFNQEVGLRLFTALCKHIKKHRISIDGSIRLISDMNHYFIYIQTLKNNELLQYFKALRELSQIYLIDASHSKDLATVIADSDRFYGIFRAEEVYEFAQRRADWYQIKKSVERAMYGVGCLVM